MAQYGTLITNIGLAQIANAQITQSKVGLEYIALGDGNGAHYVPTQNQTALVNEVWRGPISELSIDPTNDNRIIVDGVIPVTAGGFTIREIGIFDDKNQLIAVGQYPEKYKPELSEGVSEETIIHFVIETNNADVVKLTIDPTVIIASQKYVDGKMAAHTALNKTDAHQIKNIEGLENELTSIKSAIGNGSTGNDILSRLDALETKVGNLNNLETAQKANLVAAINEVRKSAINAWQKGVYNDTDITNLSGANISRIFYMNDWKAPANNIEQASIVIPVENFNGTVKVSVAGNFNTTNGSGAFEYENSYLKVGDTVHTNKRTIYKADENIAGQYYFLGFNKSESLFTIPIVRAPHALNRVTVKVEILTTFASFEPLKNAYVVYEDFGTSWHGYPWTPQTSSFVQHSTGNNYILGGAMTLGGNLSISKGIPLIEMGVPNTNTSAQFLLNASTTQDFGLEFRKNNVAYMVAHGQKQVAFLGHDEVWFTIQDLKQSASDVKKNVAQAITDKGVPTSPDATGAQMATNIRAIKTGKKTDRGTINIPALAAGTTTSVNMVVYFKPSTVVLNLDGRYMVDGQLHGNDWANRHSVYDIRVVPYDSTNWMVTFFIRGGQFGASQQYNYALFIE